MTESLKVLCQKRLGLEWNPLRKLNMKYHSFLNSIKNFGNEDERTKKEYNEVLLEIELYKFHVRSCEGLAIRTTRDLELANEETEKIGDAMDTLEKEYESLSEKLSEEEELYKQKMEYDSIASAILSLEDPEKQKQKLEELKKECKLLEDVNKRFIEKINKKMKDFSLSFTAMKILEED